jgi:anti-sigma B factor antagonist
MNLSIEIRKTENITILELAGRVSVLDTRLRELVEELVACGERYFIINLANVSYLDNSGLGQLCLVYTLARNRGGDVRLLKPTPRIQKLLNITKLDSVFKTFEQEADAIRTMPTLAEALSA